MYGSFISSYLIVDGNMRPYDGASEPTCNHKT